MFVSAKLEITIGSRLNDMTFSDLIYMFTRILLFTLPIINIRLSHSGAWPGLASNKLIPYLHAKTHNE